MASLSLLPRKELLAEWTTVSQALEWAELSSAVWFTIAEKLGDAKFDNFNQLAAIAPTDMQDAISAARFSRKKLTPLFRAKASLVYNAARAKHNLGLEDVAVSVEGPGINSQKRSVSLLESPRPVKRHASDHVKLTVRGVAGSQCELEIPANSLVGDVKKDACTRLGLSSAAAQMVFQSVPLKDADRLSELGVGTDSLLTVVIVDSIVVRRHVYNARGGAPPYRGSYLTATDTVSLLSSLPLKEQMERIIPPDGMPDKFGDMFEEMSARVTTLQKAWRGNVEKPAPKKWESQATDMDIEATAAEVFQGGDVDVIVLMPMRGCD